MDESPMSDVTGMLDRATNAVENLLADFDMELLAAPTPCTEWTVSELLDHLVTGARMFASVASGNLPATDAQQSEPSDDQIPGRRQPCRIRAVGIGKAHPTDRVQID